MSPFRLFINYQLIIKYSTLLMTKIERIIKEHYKKSEKIDISRFKGLGEMLPNQLRETTMNKSTRKLLKITMESYSSDQYAKTIDELMGNKPDARFKFIQENANFN